MIRVAHFSDLHYGTKNLIEADRCFGAAVDGAIALGVEAAVLSGDATDHGLDLHAPAAERLLAQVRRLADHCPVLMLQGTYSHEPPGTLAVFRLLGGRHAVHVAERIAQGELRHLRHTAVQPLNLCHRAHGASPFRHGIVSSTRPLPIRTNITRQGKPLKAVRHNMRPNPPPAGQANNEGAHGTGAALQPSRQACHLAKS